VNSPPPKPEVIITNFFAEPTVLLVPITSRDNYAMNIQNDVIGLVLPENCKSKQVIGFIA
jgi:hypothetical protein